VNKKTLEKIGVTAAGPLSFILSALAAAALLSWWIGSAPVIEAGPRIPVTPPEMAALADTGPGAGAPLVDIEGFFASGPGAPSSANGSWPRFRGRGLDNVARGATDLAESWEPGGPPVLWSLELGEGHGGAAVHNGRVYLLDYDEEKKSDLLRCLSLDDGRELWRRWYRTGAKRNHGTSRTVPSVSDRHVLTMGPKCHVMCADALTGDFLWAIDLVREYGTREPLWFTAQHPFLDGDTAVIAPGGRALMIGVDSRTGQVLWETPNPRGWQMSHSSIVPMTFDGRRMYVYIALGGMAGVAADGEDAGKVLWETNDWSHAVVAPSPVFLGAGRILVTAGYGAGSAIFRVRHDGKGFTVTRERSFDRREFACEQQTPILYRGHLFTVMPKDSGARRNQLVCMTAAGEPVYSSGRNHRFGLGPFLVADDKLFILNDDGLLTMSRASTTSYTPLAEARVLTGRDAWAPMAVAGGRLLLRDSKRMVCLDLRAPSAKAAAPSPRREVKRDG